VDISSLSSGGMTAGSIEGAGTYNLGSKTLTVGGNDLSTEVSGTMADGGENGGTGASLIKVGTGQVILSGLNTYTGRTTVAGGVLSVSSDANLGVSVGGIRLAGGELLTTTDGFSTARAIDVKASGGLNTLAAASGTTATFSGLLSDTGALVIGDDSHAGTVVLTGNNTYSGGTTINSGTLQIGNGLNTSSIIGDVIDNRRLAFNLGQDGTFAGNVSGTGTLRQLGPGSLTLTGTNT
jgi:autotransporter-associated beta strand protein